MRFIKNYFNSIKVRLELAEKKKAKQEHRKASEKRLCKTLCEIYPTLDEKRLVAIFKTVPEDLWNDFKTYAYNGVPKAVEQPHRWNGTMEDFVFYIMEQWIKQHNAKPEQQHQTFDFAEAEEVKPGESEWQQLVAMLDGDIGEELRKVVFVSYDGKTVLLKASREQCKKVESCLSDDVISHVKKCSKQVFGKVIAWNYSLSDN